MANHTIPIDEDSLSSRNVTHCCIPWGDTITLDFKHDVDLRYSGYPRAFDPELKSERHFQGEQSDPYTAQEFTETVTISYQRLKTKGYKDITLDIQQNCDRRFGDCPPDPPKTKTKKKKK